LERGFRTRQIAEELHVALKFAQAFNTRIKAKLNLSSAAEVRREARRRRQSKKISSGASLV
jgi:DNA-binding NarL/FixJ family response regulator